MSNIFPVMIAPRWKQLFTAAAIAPNLLCGPLQNAGLKPVPPGDPSLPAPRSYPVPLRTWIGQVNLGLLGKDQFFGVPGQPLEYDQQPPPRAAYRLPQTWLGQINQNLLGKDVFYGAAGQAPQFDQKLPVSPAGLRRGWGQNLLLTTLAPVASAPFSNPDSRLPLGWALDRSAGDFAATIYLPPNTPPLSLYDWPLPARAPRLEQTWTQNLLEATLGPTPPAPFVSADWPLPRASPPLVRGEGRAIPLAILAGASAPFASIDARVPAGAAWAITLRTWTSGPTLLGQDTLFGGPGRPLSNFDWQLPRIAQRAVGEGQRPPLALLTVIPSPPFVTVDGRLPTAAVFPLALRTWNTAPSLLGQDAFFGGPGQPPTNASALPAPEPALLQAWSVSVPLTLLAAQPAPFASVDSRLPAQVPRSAQGWTQNLLLSTLFAQPPMPLNLFDTRRPVLRVPSALNWIGQPITAFFGIGLPFQTPRITVKPEDLRSLKVDADRTVKPQAKRTIKPA